MTIKQKLKIALELIKVYDFVPRYDDYDLKDIVNEINGEFSRGDIYDVMQEYGGWGLEYVTEEIINRYFYD